MKEAPGSFLNHLFVHQFDGRTQYTRKFPEKQTWNDVDDNGYDSVLLPRLVWGIKVLLFFFHTCTLTSTYTNAGSALLLESCWVLMLFTCVRIEAVGYGFVEPYGNVHERHVDARLPPHSKTSSDTTWGVGTLGKPKLPWYLSTKKHRRYYEQWNAWWPCPWG